MVLTRPKNQPRTGIVTGVPILCLTMLVHSCGTGVSHLGRPPGHNESNDGSMELRAILNDTVFSLRTLALDSPVVNFELRNTGSVPYIIPYADCYIRPCDIMVCGCGFGSLLGIGEGRYDSPGWGYDIDTFFHDSTNWAATIDAGEIVCGDASYGVFDLHVVDRITPGRYWVQVILESYIPVDTVPPGWIGKAESDTLWFRITE